MCLGYKLAIADMAANPLLLPTGRERRANSIGRAGPPQSNTLAVFIRQ